VSFPVIGVFDSGVGGLTVLRAIHRRVPWADTAYLGDTARVPYGTRSAETVVRYAKNAARFLVSRERLGVLVVACNTVSAVALDVLAGDLEVPVIGVVEPTAARAVALSSAGRIGIIGTPGTVRSGAYERAVRRLRADAMTISRACPLFVPLAEEGWTDPSDPIARAIAERYLSPFGEVDTLILGCTHYPLLEPIIRSVLPVSTQLADAAEAVAESIAPLVRERAEGVGQRRYYVTDVPKGFSEVAARFLGDGIHDPIEVDLG